MKTNIYQLIFIKLSLYTILGYGKIPTVRLCGDRSCKEIISMGKTTCTYNAGDKDMVSFRGNTACRVLSKSVGEDSNLWEIEVQGRRGYAPKNMIMEQKIIIKAADLIPIMEEPNLSSSEKSTSENVSFDNNISSQFEIGTETTAASDDAETINEEQIDSTSSSSLSVKEPLAIKIEMFKTGISQLEKFENEGSSKMSSNTLQTVKKVDEDNIEHKQNYMSHDSYATNIKAAKIGTENIKLTLETSTIDKNLKMDLNMNSNLPEETNNKLVETVSKDIGQKILNETEPISNSSDIKESSNVHISVESERSQLTTTENKPNFFSSILSKKKHASDKKEVFVPEFEEKFENNIMSFSVDDDNKQPVTNDERSNIHVVQDKPIENVVNPQLKLGTESLLPPDVAETNIAEQIDSTSLSSTLVDEPSAKKIDMVKTVIDKTEKYEKNVKSKKGDDEEHNVEERAENKQDIFTAHSYPESFIQDDEKSWYDILNSMLYNFKTFIQSFYKYFWDGKNGSSYEQCEIDLENDERRNNEFCSKSWQSRKTQKFHHVDYKSFTDSIASQLIVMADLIILLILVAFTILIFIFGHYCIVGKRKECLLVSKMNKMERKLFLSEKDCSIAKAEILEKQKILDDIANKFFGADDMMKQIKKEKSELQEQIIALEKELEVAAEAGLELNKMVAELLNNQSGSDSIIHSVEELQQQLNEQEATSIYINNLLAEKSRENSELKIQLSESNKKFENQIDEILNVNKKLEEEKKTVEAEMNNIVEALKLDVEEKINGISQYKEEYKALDKKYNDINLKWQTCQAQVETMKKALSKNENTSLLEIVDANVKYFAVEKENEFLKECLANEQELKKRLQDQIIQMNSEISRFRSVANQNEKEKLKAQTRLDVLSCYFKEKETQLQSELGIKEALFMKQKGESTTTVERIQQLQNEIQGLRSQNDQLRAEIETQLKTHKAQINSVEMRAYDSWLATKQAERRLEASELEASVLRKKLTSLTQNIPVAAGNNTDEQTPDFNGPSPNISSPLMNFLPPPPTSLFNPSANVPIPFMPPPPPPLEIRPAPLGRLMSPPLRIPEDRYRYRDTYMPDFSPPRSPNLPKSPRSPSGSSSDGKSIHSSDEWDRRTY